MTGIVSILIPAPSIALTTLANAKLELNVSVSDDDAYLTLLINRCSAVIQSYIGRAIGTQTVQETFRGTHANFHGLHPASSLSYQIKPLIATYLPVNTISSIVEDTNAPLVQNTDYELEGSAGLLWRLSGSSRTQWAGSATVVTYTSGYVLPQDSGSRNLPFEIEDCVLSLIKNEYYSRGQDPSIILEVTEGVGRTQYNSTRSSSSGLSDDIKTALAPYRSFVW